MTTITSPGSLTPRTLLEILDRTFQIYRDYFTQFIGLVAGVTIPLTLFSTFATALLISPTTTMTTDEFAMQDINSLLLGTGIFQSGILALFIGLLQTVLIHTPLTYMTSEYQLGRKVGLREAFQAVGDRLPQVGIGLFLFYLSLVLLSIGMWTLLFLCGFGVSILVYVGISLFAFLVQVLTLERTDVRRGLSRAWYLARARFWQVAGFMLLVGIITLVVTLVLSALQQLFLGGLTTNVVFNVISNLVVSIIVAPVLPIGLTLMYYDTRVRVEGLDIALNAVDSAEPRPSDVASPRPTQLLNGRDAGNIVVLTLFLFGIGALLTLLFAPFLTAGTTGAF
jgi:MFS family permease